jgi:hypothetical protein
MDQAGRGSRTYPVDEAELNQKWESPSGQQGAFQPEAGGEERCLPRSMEPPSIGLCVPARPREMAVLMDDEVAQRAMLAIADNYETVAKRAEARAAGVDLPNFPKTGQ